MRQHRQRWLAGLAGMILLVLLSGCAASGGIEGRGAGQDRWWTEQPRPGWLPYPRVLPDEPWFEVHRVSDGVFALYEPGQYEEAISFLIVGSERALLFDTGIGVGDIRHAVSRLTDREIVVLNSHTHYDHIGGNYQFRRIYGTDLAYSQANARGSTVAGRAEFIQPAWLSRPLPPGFDASAYRSRPFTITDIVHDGDIIDLGGRRLEVIMTPGHAPDSLCLLDRDRRILFTGDSFYLAGLYTHIEGSNLADYARSAARLAALAPAYDLAYTAHNEPVADVHYMIALNDAFAAIRAATAPPPVETDGFLEYFFDGFSIIVDPAALPAFRAQ